MFRVACCLLFASLCLPIIAQDAPQTEQETVEGWIVGASDRVFRFVHFTADGEHLLAVIDQRITDATAPEDRQVLVKISLASGQITWTSEPFANCQGMVPYPAFDLQVFHDATGSGL